MDFLAEELTQKLQLSFGLAKVTTRTFTFFSWGYRIHKPSIASITSKGGQTQIIYFHQSKKQKNNILQHQVLTPPKGHEIRCFPL